MTPPRMRVGIVGTRRASDIGALLEQAGHHVTRVNDPHEVAGLEMIVLEAGAQDLDERVEAIAPFVHRGQIVAHTCIGAGAQALDAAEISGAVVIAAAPIGGDFWATDSLDELGSTIAEMIVAECGGVSIPVSEHKRQELAAAQTHAYALKRLADDTAALTTKAVGESLATEIAGELATPKELPQVGEIEEQQRSIKDPALRRSFTQLAGRAAQLDNIPDVELWALREALREDSDGI